MPVQRIRNQPPGLSVPADLPDNVPVEFRTTYQKVVGEGAADSVAESIDDYRHAQWVVYRQGDNGWAEKGIEVGRPYAYRLRGIYGPGRYKVVPISPDGDPVERLAQIENVAGDSAEAAPAAGPTAPQDDLPPFMRLMLAQQAEERAEARRAALEAHAKREEWEREQRQREWERAEREERRERARQEKEAEERRLAAERTDKLLAAGMTLAGTLMQSITTAVAARPAPSGEGRGINEALLAAALRPQQAGNGIKDTLDMLLVLDQVAEKRAERAAPPPAEREEKEDPGLMGTLQGMLPMLLAMRGGAAPQAAAAVQALERPGADPTQAAEGMVTAILRDPVALSELASRDPDGTARVFLAAVQRNPQLQASVAKVFTEAQQ